MYRQSKGEKPIIYAQYTQAQEKYQYCECKNIPKTHINTLNTHTQTHTHTHTHTYKHTQGRIK